MDKYALGTDIPIRWTLGEYTPAESVYFEIYTGAGRKRVTDFTIDENVLSWTFSGSDQSAYGVYGLHLIAGSQEYRLDNAFELIHGTPSEQPEPQSLSSSVDIDATTPQEEPSESTGPAEYVSDSPIHVEKIPLGSNIILNWNLLTTESFDFDLEECDLALYYSAAGSGKKQATDFTLLTENGYTVQWNFAGADQTRYGLYSLFLDIYYEGEKIATLVREDGFALVHRRGSEFLADRIISFDSVVTTLGGGALYSLADVLNDGYSTVYREDGETPAAQGDILLFDGERWVASNDADLGSTDRLAEQITALTTRVSGDENDIAALGRDLAAAQVTIGSNTSRIARNEADILDINTALSGLSGSISNLNEDVVAIQISEAGIATRVTDAEGNISSLQQTAEGFDLRVSDVEGDVGELTLTSEALAGRISDAEGDIGVLELTATGLTTRITSAEGDIGALELTATSLTTRIANTEGDVSTLQQTATGLTSRVSDAEGNISVLQQTATGLQYQVDNQSGDIATLQVSARGLTSRVTNAEGDISVLDQRADSIELSVQGIDTELTRYEGVTDAALANMQDQIDGVIETWYYNGVPTLNNLPASQWTTDDEKNNHIGDLYYDKDTGKAYRFMLDSSETPAVYKWVELADEDIAKALALAGEKKRVFVATPYAPYDVGDLWVRAKTVGSDSTNEIWRCKTSRAADASPAFLESEWESADNYGYVVNKSNLEVLSNAIVGQVGTYTYNSDGTLKSSAASTIAQTATSIRLATVVDNVALAGITIDATNQTGSVTIFSDNFYIKDGSYNKTALAITHDALGNSIIDVDSINVNGILSAPRILSSKIEMVDGSNNVTAGLSGIYDSTKLGNGIAAWYGGPDTDWKTLSAAERLTTPYAKSLFRMDGSGYLASGEIQWGASGEIILHGTSIEAAEIDGDTTFTYDGQTFTVADLLVLKSLFTVEEYDTTNHKYRLKLAASTGGTGIDGFYVQGALWTDGDQIVGSGTPGGGGGGGAGYLYELGDIYHDTNKTKVLRTDGTTPAAVGDVLQLTSLAGGNKWAAVPASSIGGVTSVVGQTGDVTATQISTAIGLGNYLPLSLSSTYYITRSDDNWVLHFKNTSSSGGSHIGFFKNTNYLGTVGFDDSGNLVTYGGSPASYRTVYHSGNLTKSVLTGLLDASGGYYLPLTGGTLSGTNRDLLKINSTNENGPYIAMHLSGTFKGRFGCTASGPFMYNQTSHYEFGVYSSGFFFSFDGGSNAAMLLDTSGRLGIGATPAHKLHVVGNAGWTSKIVGTKSIVNLAHSDGYGLAVESTSSSSSTYLFGCWYGQSTLGSGGNYALFVRGDGNVGVRTSTPAYSLDVAGVSRSYYHYFYHQSQSAEGGYVGCGSSSKRVILQANSGYELWFYSDGSNVGAWTSTGLGIGTSSPAYKLDVNGAIHCGDLTFNYGYGHGVISGGDTNGVYIGGAKGGLGSSYTGGLLYAYGNNPIYFYTASAQRMIITGGGNVGIGTNSPTCKLHVVGSGGWTSQIYGADSLVSLAHSSGYGMAVESKVSSSSYYLLGCWYGQTTLGAGGNVALYVRGDGNVGVGRNDPAYSLDVAGVARSRVLISYDGTGTASTTLTSAAAQLELCTNGTRSGTVGQYLVGIAFKDLYNYGGGTTYNTYAHAWIGTRLTSTQGAEYADLAFALRKGTDVYPTEVAHLTKEGVWTTTGDQVISSDINLKTHLEPVKYTIEDIAKCRAVTFDWKDGRGKSAGSIAQDWKPLIPELVHGEEGNMTLAYGQIALINSILLAKHETEQDKEIKKLKNRVKELENEVKRLRS